MSKLKLTVACGDYDRVLPLRDGRVQPEGVDLNFLTMQPEELFWRMLQNEAFDASELSLGAYLIMTGKGDRRFVGIPVFPSRMFRHSTIFINRNSGIRCPEDILGKRIGVPDYTMTAPLWQRGMFSDLYHVKPGDVTWYFGGMNQPGRKQRIAFTPPADVSLNYIGESRTLSDMLKEGEIDALFTSRNVQCYKDHHPHVIRLWNNYMGVEQDYYRETGIFPIMHLVVIRRKICEQNPWLPASLYKAFDAAKRICFNEMLSSTALKYSSPWYLGQLQQAVELMGPDFWPYGVEENAKELSTVCRYAYEQGLVPKAIQPTQLFDLSTVEQYRI